MSELITEKKAVNYGFTQCVMLRPYSKNRFKQFGQCAVSYEKVLVRMMDILDAHPEIKKQVTEFNGYDKMEIPY
jgi:hypothetical protein